MPPHGPVALVLRALRLGADVGDLGERAVAAVAAAEERHLGRLLERRARPCPRLRRLLDAAVERPPGREERRVAREDGVVEPPAEAVLQRHAQVGPPASLRLEVGRVHARRRRAPSPGRARRSGTRPRAGTGSRARARASRRREGLRAVEDLAEGRPRACARRGRRRRSRGRARPRRAWPRGRRRRPGPLSGLAPWRSASSSSSSVTTTPGILPARNARAARAREQVDVRERAQRRGRRARIQRRSSSSLRVSQPIWLITKRAPACAFLRSLKYWGITSRSCRLWFVTTQPRKKSVRSRRASGLRSSGSPSFMSAKRLEQADRVDVEHGRGEPRVPGDGVVAREREHVVEALARRAASRGSRARCGSSPCRRGG